MPGKSGFSSSTAVFLAQSVEAIEPLLLWYVDGFDDVTASWQLSEIQFA